MLKHFPIFALAGVCFASVAFAETFTADKEFLTKQKRIYELFYLKDDVRDVFPEIASFANSYDISDPSTYIKKHVVDEFLQRFKHGTLPRDRPFSVFYPEQLDEAVALFKLFYYAKDFDTFFKTAAWAQFHCNQGQYVYALSAAVFHRPDTKYLRIPAFYEIYPYFFFNSEVFMNIHNHAEHTRSKSVASSGSTIIIPANYSGWYARYTKDQEYKLNYFREDPALGNIYAITQLGHPFWLPAKEFRFNSEIRGEIFFLAYRIQYARYLMERLSHGLGEVLDINWEEPIPVGYYPTQMYHNGLPFPQRAEFSRIPSYKQNLVKTLMDYEARISDAIDSGMIVTKTGKLMDIYGPEGIHYLGNLIEGNADSMNRHFYGHYDALARNVLGFSPEPIDKYMVVPSILEEYTASPRDPIFWSLIKKYVNFYDQYVTKLPKYTLEHLAFPGVKIQSVKIDDLVTFFDTYDFLLDANAKGNKVFVRQSRLNHKPYNYHINVHSDKDIRAQINIFLGPKYDVYGNEYDITTSYKYFMPLDHWIVDLKSGSNKIVRKSADSFITHGEDELRGDEFYAKIMRAFDGNETFTYTEKTYGYPERCIIPKGTKEGFPLQFFFYVGPVDTKIKSTGSRVWGDRIYLEQSQGFPLDRPPFAFNFTLPNYIFEDVTVFHKE